MKRVLALLLCLILVLSIFPSAALAEENPVPKAEPDAATANPSVGTVYRHWDAADATVTFNNDPEGGTAIDVLDKDTILGDDAERIDVTRIVFDCYVLLGNGRELFKDFCNLNVIEGLDRVDTFQVTDMSWMFFGCRSLTSLDLSNVNTTQVRTMECMFSGCSGLTTLDVSGFDTSSADTMHDMFTACDSLQELKVSAHFGEACEMGLEATFPVDMMDLYSGEAMPESWVIPQYRYDERTYVAAPCYTVNYSAPCAEKGVPGAQAKLPGVDLILSDMVPEYFPGAIWSYYVTLIDVDSNNQPVSTSLQAISVTVHDFKEWNTAESGDGTSYKPGDTYSADEDVTLYAQWNHGIEMYPVELPTPTREGYIFKGWGLSPDDTEGITGSYTPTEDVTLYALWEAEVCVHTDEDGDLFCDACSERLGINVTVSSASGALDGSTVAFVSGGGKLYYGESTLLSAPTVSGYVFDGWYCDGDVYSRSAQVSFTATEQDTADVAFVALYMPQIGVQRRLTVMGSKFTISNIFSEQFNSFSDQLDIDSEITVTYTGDKDFLFWMNGSDKIMGTSKELSFHLVADTKMTAICADPQNHPDGAYVVFVTSPDNGQLIVSRYYGDTEKIKFPPAPIRVGFAFDGWTLSEDEIHVRMASENWIAVYPTYSPLGGTYTVTIENNVGAEPFVSEPIGAGLEYMAHADPALGELSYWKLGDKIVSYNEVLVLRSLDDMTLTAVYNEERMPMPVITMTYVCQTPNGQKAVITFSSMRAVTEEYTVESVGTLYSTRSDLEGKSQDELRALLILGADGVNQRTTESKARNAVYNLNLTASKPVHVYGRAFMILMKDGVSYTFYSDEILDLEYIP